MWSFPGALLKIFGGVNFSGKTHRDMYESGETRGR